MSINLACPTLASALMSRNASFAEGKGIRADDLISPAAWHPSRRSAASPGAQLPQLCLPTHPAEGRGKRNLHEMVSCDCNFNTPPKKKKPEDASCPIPPLPSKTCNKSTLSSFPIAVLGAEETLFRFVNRYSSAAKLLLFEKNFHDLGIPDPSRMDAATIT